MHQSSIFPYLNVPHKFSSKFYLTSMTCVLFVGTTGVFPDAETLYKKQPYTILMRIYLGLFVVTDKHTISGGEGLFYYMKCSLK